MVIKNIWQKIMQSETIIIFRHVKPDGDATGSQMGLKHLINTNLPGKKVFCVGEPTSFYGKLLGNVDLGIELDLIKEALAIVLDTPNIERVDNQAFLQAEEIIKIDHHLFVDDFKGLEWIDNEAGSTCEMIAQLALDNNLLVSKECAECLYLGMVTDSNRFLYGTNKYAFKAADFLMKASPDLTRIYDFLYESEERLIRFKGYCQQYFEKTENGVAYNKIDEKTLEHFDITGHDAAGVVNVISGIKGIKIHAHFCAIEDDLIRVELRSKQIPVNEVAIKYGGGGHKLASGVRIHSWDIADAIIHDLDKLCKGND